MVPDTKVAMGSNALFPTLTRRAKWTFIGRKRSGIGANFGNVND